MYFHTDYLREMKEASPGNFPYKYDILEGQNFYQIYRKNLVTGKSTLIEQIYNEKPEVFHISGIRKRFRFLLTKFKRRKNE